MITFSNIEQVKVSMDSKNGVFLCNTPAQFKQNLKSKKLAVQRCIMSNHFVPLFVFEQLQQDKRKLIFPDGSPILYENNALNMMLGIRTLDTNTNLYSYEGKYLEYLNPQLVNGGSTNPLDIDYYFVYDINKLCLFISSNISQIAGFSDLFSVILEYDGINNLFVLSIIESLLTNVDIICNKAFVDKFNFSNTLIGDDLYKLNFSELFSTTINNIIYDKLTSYVPYNFIPFDAVLITSNMQTQPLQMYSNANSSNFVNSDTVIQIFDRVSSNLNFYDFFFVNNTTLLKYINFTTDTQDISELNFKVYLYNSNQDKKIPVIIKDKEILNFEFLVCYS